MPRTIPWHFQYIYILYVNILDLCNPKLGTPVDSATVRIVRAVRVFVWRDWFAHTVSYRHHTLLGYAFFDQVVYAALCACLREFEIVWIRAFAVGV